MPRKVSMNNLNNLLLLIFLLKILCTWTSVVFDASDLVKGRDEEDDFNNCIREIVHIRNCLQLSTLRSKRSNRIAGRIDSIPKLALRCDERKQHQQDEEGSSSDDDNKNNGYRGNEEEEEEEDGLMTDCSSEDKKSGFP